MAAKHPKIFEKLKKSQKQPSMVTIEHHKHGCTCFQKNFPRAYTHADTDTHTTPLDKVRVFKKPDLIIHPKSR